MKKIYFLLVIVLVMSACAPSAHTSTSRHYTSTSGCSSAKQCEDLGVRYITGAGVRINGYKALRYLERACTMGRSSACNSAAFIYADAEGGVKQDYRKALDYWSRSCRLGDRRGCKNYDLAQAKLRELRSSRR